MKVANLYNPLTVVAHPWEDLSEAARRMTRNDVGSLAIYAHGRLAGILTERDLTRAVADGVDLSHTTVEEYMTSEPTTTTPETDAREAAVTMLGLGVRHIPVLSDHMLLGMVSIRDVLEDLVWTADAPSA